MSDQGSVTRWFHQAKDGDEQAIEALWKRFYVRLVDYSRSKLPRGRSQAKDEEDVVLSAFETFFQRARQGEFPSVQNRDSIWRLLLVIASGKAANQVAHEVRQKRGGGRTVHISTGESLDSCCETPVFAAIIAKEPTPDFALQVAEEYRRLMESLGDSALIQVATMKFEGFENKEIAQKMDMSVRSVERKLNRIRMIWSECQGNHHDTVTLNSA
jgi:DNA-directed RNA polymerase specialized sigma24 family protein